MTVRPKVPRSTRQSRRFANTGLFVGASLISLVACGNGGDSQSNTSKQLGAAATKDVETLVGYAVPKAAHIGRGNVANTTQSLPLFVEEAYKQYETEAAFSAAVLLALLAAVTLVIKEILESKTRIKDE